MQNKNLDDKDLAAKTANSSGTSTTSSFMRTKHDTMLSGGAPTESITSKANISSTRATNTFDKTAPRPSTGNISSSITKTVAEKANLTTASSSTITNKNTSSTSASKFTPTSTSTSTSSTPTRTTSTTSSFAKPNTTASRTTTLTTTATTSPTSTFAKSSTASRPSSRTATTSTSTLASSSNYARSSTNPISTSSASVLPSSATTRTTNTVRPNPIRGTSPLERDSNARPKSTHSTLASSNTMGSTASRLSTSAATSANSKFDKPLSTTSGVGKHLPFTSNASKSSTLSTPQSTLIPSSAKPARAFPEVPVDTKKYAYSSETKSQTNPQTTSTSTTTAKFAGGRSSNEKSQLSDKEFFLLRDFIHKQSGIYINDNRKYLIQNRLTSIINEMGLSSFSEYYEHLTTKDSSRISLNKLFEAITTNETFFFRNIPQLDTVRDVILKKIIAENKTSRKIRIWSAGCSSGEEPYTIAIMLSELLGAELSKWDIKITANDLSPAVLALAKEGTYSDYSLRTTPPELLAKYFDKDGLIFRVKDSLKKLINFGQINLNESSQTSKVEKSQLVLCRNVIIYFDDDVKRNVVKNFYDNLMDGGVLVIGHSESLHNITDTFEPRHYPGTVVYHKK